MKLSVIIVNHNLGMWLRQCISALVSASKNIDYEMIVVDNASTDGSDKIISEEFQNLRFIQNKKNIGIAKAYNQAIEVSKGEYVLLVSPDTITGKKSLEKLINFMDEHPLAGGATVRMVTHRGDYISSSKNGMGKAWAKLIKWTGLAKYFPKSHLFPQKISHIADEYETAEIDVINSSFMMMRRAALNQIGLFDARFVMFGYNIDLSFRLKIEGFKNYYFPKTYVINFNVSQPAKHTWAYLKHFYGAMFIFVAKYLFEAPKLTLGNIAPVYRPQYEVER
ncbi:MAG: glycosyltransferase family 2 protein [Sphingobacteriaceae bacterium]|nr:MAG: glycosyltransferase family 2 protein [Sphingobacteriaceae bacterium]